MLKCKINYFCKVIIEILKKLFTTTFCIFALWFSAQTGTKVYPFLNVPVSARQAVLGGDAVSVRDYDVNFAAINPALMNLDMDNRIGINYGSYIAGSHLGSINYVKDLSAGHFISVNARVLDFGKTPRTDEFGNVNGEFSAMDASFGVGYAYQFDDDFTIGANVNYLTSKIDNYTSSAISANAGVTYHNEQSKETVALVFRNFGYQIKSYNGTKEQLPFRADIGYTRILPEFPLAYTITYHDLQQFNISQSYDINGKEVGFGRKLMDHLSGGIELFPEQAFNIRMGYNVKRGNELAVLDQRNFSGFSFGFGIKISSFRFDYSHVRYHNADNVNQIGLMLDLVELSGNRR